MNIIIIRSNRKTISIQVNPDLSVTVRAPKRASSKYIEQILQKKEPWINRHIQQIKRKMA